MLLKKRTSLLFVTALCMGYFSEYLGLITIECEVQQYVKVNDIARILVIKPGA